MILDYLGNVCAVCLQMHFVDQMLELLDGRLVGHFVLQTETLELLALQNVFRNQIVSQHIVFEQLWPIVCS